MKKSFGLSYLVYTNTLCFILLLSVVQGQSPINSPQKKILDSKEIVKFNKQERVKY